MSCLALSLQPANGSDILLQTRVDVTPEKLSRKYAEIYMALDIVLRGVSSIRLAAMLGSMHGNGLAKMVTLPLLAAGASVSKAQAGVVGTELWCVAKNNAEDAALQVYEVSWATSLW